MTDRNNNKEETPPKGEKFDLGTVDGERLVHDRRASGERRGRKTAGTGAAAAKSVHPDRPPTERRAKKERRRRIDPTTFEKQYTDDEIEFMNAMQHFKNQSGRSFPTYGEVLKVAYGLGYRKVLAQRPGATIDRPMVRVDRPAKSRVPRP
jgi:hypothetical protein